MERHHAAMQIVQQLSEPERVAVLAFVVAPSPAVREAQEMKQ